MRLLLLRHIPFLNRRLNRTYYAKLRDNMNYFRFILALYDLDIYKVDPKAARVEDTEYSIYPYLRCGLKPFEFVALLEYSIDSRCMERITKRCIEADRYGR